MNALELLKSDHQRVSELFEQLQQSKDFEQKRDFFEMIREELTIHSLIEETIFYPALKDRPGFEEIIQDSYDDHQEIKELLNEVDSIDDETEMDNCLDELEEIVDDHVDEEENELFPKVLQIMNDQELEQMGRLLEQAKQKPSRAA